MKSALITGGSGGIGAAAANRLAADGFEVWVGDIDLPAAESVVTGILNDGGSGRATYLDVADEVSVNRTFSELADDVGRLDVLINAAAVIGTHAFDDIPTASWLQTYQVNVVGTYFCIKYALPLLRVAAPARIINLASGAAKTAGPYTAPYHASKAAIISLTRSAAMALAPDVLVNCVCPGVIDTPMWDTIDRGLEDIGAPEASRFASRVRAIPIRRAGTPSEVADVLAFLASEASGYMTGEDLNVSGGAVMH
jgi:NAD(P)-dependent dehydrogenase (short-subunit alcohol dehydrogenase family)